MSDTVGCAVERQSTPDGYYNVEAHGVCFELFHESPQPRFRALTDGLPGN